MEPEASLPCSEEHATGTYAESYVYTVYTFP
jgi:hypothetical protein